MTKHKNYSKEFKFKVSLEMIRGDLTIAEIIAKYEVPRSVVHRSRSNSNVMHYMAAAIAIKSGLLQHKIKPIKYKTSNKHNCKNTFKAISVFRYGLKPFLKLSLFHPAKRLFNKIFRYKLNFNCTVRL
ncbi:MAG: hypothetical protein AAF153_01315, partial [Pseudomonadota bacterium]